MACAGRQQLSVLKKVFRGTAADLFPISIVRTTFLLLLATLLLGGVACKSKKKPARVVYINRSGELTPAAQNAVAVAKAEIEKWDQGVEVVDYRVQRHARGWVVSLLVSGALDDLGNPVYGDTPIRNVEVDKSGEVIGYHVSR